TVYGAGGGNVSRTCFPAADGLECPARGRAGEPAARHAAAPSFGRCRGNMDRWQQLQELFEKASALDPAEVPGFLAREEPDPGLRAEVMALLRADSSREGLTSLVGRVASGAELEGLEAGMLVGPWRLLEERGAGGMGTVFRAERADGAYERIVAIKFLRGPPSRDAAERMRRERQILANLDHPNIARLIDGGTTP